MDTLPPCQQNIEIGVITVVTIFTEARSPYKLITMKREIPGQCKVIPGSLDRLLKLVKSLDCPGQPWMVGNYGSSPIQHCNCRRTCRSGSGNRKKGGGGGGGETMGKKLALPMPMRARGPSMQNNAWEIVWESKKCVSAHKKSRRKI